MNSDVAIEPESRDTFPAIVLIGYNTHGEDVYMKGKRITLVKMIKLLMSILFVVGIILIALFPFDKRNLSLQFITEEGKYEIVKHNDEIDEDKLQCFIFEDVDALKIKELRIYGNIKSMCLEKIRYEQLTGYIANVEKGEIQWEEDGIVLAGNDEIQLIMNEAFNTLLKEHSSTFLLERLILAELFAVIIAFIWIMLKMAEEKAVSDSRDNHGPVYEIKKFGEDIKKYWQYTVYAAKTDLKAEVANSYLNRLWWLLEPFFNMLVYVIVFGKVMGHSIQNYATFVFSALLMWNFFNKTINYSVKLVRNNKDIVTKVYIPKFVLLISNMILNMLKLLFSLIVLAIMLLLFRVQIGVNIFWVLPAYAVMVLLAFGAGMIFLHFGVYVDDLSYAVGILLNMLMFLSGIFYEVMTTLPAPLNTLMMCLNPVALFLDTMRNALIYNQLCNVPLICIWLLISIILCCVGVHIVYKNENSYVKVV